MDGIIANKYKKVKYTAGISYNKKVTKNKSIKK